MPPLTASISGSPASGPAPLTVSLTCSASGGTGALSYVWDFGDNTVGAGASTTHTYSTIGVYFVSCEVTDSATPEPNSVAPTQPLAISVGTGSPVNPSPVQYTPQFLTSSSGYQFRFNWETGYQYIRARDGNKIVVPMFFNFQDEGGLAQDLISTAQYIPGDGVTPGSGKIQRQCPYQSGWRPGLYLQGWGGALLALYGLGGVCQPLR